jgi:hypothetical protein
MGTAFEFVCPGCGYRAIVSGGRDVGMSAVVRTMTCADCVELVDVLIGHWGQDGPTGNPDYDKNLDICPECSRANVRPWPSHHPCPRCSGQMIKDEDSGLLMWD